MNRLGVALWGAALLAAATVLAKEPGPPPPIALAGAQGQAIDLQRHLVPGKITIFQLFSLYCPSCAYTTPKVERLAREFPDFVLRKIDINRPGVVGADFDSPVARQFELTGIPHFKIYDATGKFRAEGKKAYHQVLTWHWYFVEKQGTRPDPAGKRPVPEED